MKTAIIVCCFFFIAFGFARADEADPEIPAEEVENEGKNLEEGREIIGSEVALMDPGSSEDAPDPVNSDGDVVIRAKRYCGYGGCCGGCNCNCATMAPVTYGPCGCCGCGYG
ncbi:hypothetical protein ANCDUO_14918 [Ancylostoma duodenale]|uniref:Uncharacterized protein n=1 Tax=Ancylostoma duodenale TaxID=51022 RepID=A0A0C2CF32_9BILA|nr:hypothetical protein ANCDUO_14918 [Ancylostoma duodenale]